MREHKCNLKVYYEELCTQLKNWKYEGYYFIMSIYGNEDTITGKLGNRLRLYQILLKDILQSYHLTQNTLEI